MPESIKQRILTINDQKVKEFAEQQEVRERWEEEHPTKILVTKCMDGRVHLAQSVGIPPFVLTPLRNLGGKYDLGWPMLRATINEWEDHARRERRPGLAITTYHYSNGDTTRGCAGFKNDKEAARAHVQRFRDQLNVAYAGRVYAIIAGLNTDDDALTLHNHDMSDQLDLGDFSRLSDRNTERLLAPFFPGMPASILRDIIHMVQNNLSHVQENRRNGGRPAEDLSHKESIFALGQGFDWLPERTAIIVGPCDPNLSEPVITAASIIQHNHQQGLVPDGGVLLVSVPYHRKFDRAGAEEQARYLARFALDHIRKTLPEMADFFQPLVGTLDYKTRRFHPCSF